MEKQQSLKRRISRFYARHQGKVLALTLILLLCAGIGLTVWEIQAEAAKDAEIVQLRGELAKREMDTMRTCSREAWVGLDRQTVFVLEHQVTNSSLVLLNPGDEYAKATADSETIQLTLVGESPNGVNPCGNTFVIEGKFSQPLEAGTLVEIAKTRGREPLAFQVVGE